MGFGSVGSSGSVPTTLAAVANLADNQNQLRELDDFIEVAETQVPQVREPRKRSPLELILQALQPAATAFAASQAARPRDRRRAFLGALVQGGAGLGLREVARPGLQREEQQRAEDARRLTVLDVASRGQLAEQRRLRTEQLGRPRTLEEVQAGRVSEGNLTVEDALAARRPPVNLQRVVREDGSTGLLNPTTGEVFNPFESFEQPDIGAPPVIGRLFPPAIRERGVALEPPPLLRSVGPEGTLFDVRGNRTVFTAPPRQEKPPSSSERKETERQQASDEIDFILSRADVNGNALEAANLLRTGRSLGLHNYSTAQVNILLDVLEARFKPRRGVDPTGTAGRESATDAFDKAVGRGIQ